MAKSQEFIPSAQFVAAKNFTCNGKNYVRGDLFNKDLLAVSKLKLFYNSRLICYGWQIQQEADVKRQKAAQLKQVLEVKAAKKAEEAKKEQKRAEAVSKRAAKKAKEADKKAEKAKEDNKYEPKAEEENKSDK